MREEKKKQRTAGQNRGAKPVLPFFESLFMPQPSFKNLERARLLQGALSRWDNEGGHQSSADPDPLGQGSHDVPPLTNAELVQLQIRVIALENLVVALLSSASAQQLDLVRDIAASIFPRPGTQHHRLTVKASAQMEHLAQRSMRL